MKPIGLVKVIHISDVHFTRLDLPIGTDHAFDPRRTPAGDYPNRAGWPELSEMLARDLVGDDPGFPVLFCLTGDFVHTGHPDEFRRAKELVRQLAKIKVFGRERGLSSMFLTPGNHDVSYEEPDEKKRSINYIEFHNDVLQSDFDSKNPYTAVQLHDRVDDLGVMVLCFHSAIWVRKGANDQDRGAFDEVQYGIARDALKKTDPDRLRGAIRIALIHHHPVLIPPLVEKGYDAILNSGNLLKLLREYGFHLVLHGHKHYPFNFTYDARSPFHPGGSLEADGRLTIVGAGSAGSRSIPDLGQKCNCYNHITIRWNPEFQHFRARIETRRLRTRDEKNEEISPVDWSWDSLDEDDRSYSGSRLLDAELPPAKAGTLLPFEPNIEPAEELARKSEYERARGNMPVIEVRPSLVKGQDRYFEARVWIVPHSNRVWPKRVVWSAGPKFEKVVAVARDQDETFCASFFYHDGMLIQGRLEFDNGESALVSVYARLPHSYA